ncbi:hypothetical protein [Fulvimarina sp. MAC8]|uniref:hypothetical protein n=1 Tax=Fulvimarina sp. MAC8 TaxID=3162874 RepID=UPI0032EBB86B
MARWQPVSDKTPVALFLARVAANEPDLQDSSEAVSHYANLLRDARRHYIETPRMISNRLIQGGDYLTEGGTPMPLDTLLIELESIGGKEPRSFADDLHHYINLRDAGADHEAAIADLARAGERR